MGNETKHGTDPGSLLLIELRGDKRVLHQVPADSPEGRKLRKVVTQGLVSFEILDVLGENTLPPSKP